MSENQKLKRWELALMLGVAFAALLGVWLSGEQKSLADRVIRLHVIANSDSEADQRLKLQVRDRVLEVADGLVEKGCTMEEAQQTLQGQLAALAVAGAEVVEEKGCDYPVTASLEEEVWFPTREYGALSLPAGNYTALRVVIGEGRGQNWWCVAFPPLCLGSVTEQAAETMLSDAFEADQIGLISGENSGYVIRFKAVELWQELCHRIECRRNMS